MSETAAQPAMARYHRQMLLPSIGDAGQARLGAAHALIVGCGALGCAIADTLARAGVGRLTIIDRDVVELTNLQRQVLFDEADARDGVPKAVAAQTRLAKINRSITIEARVNDFGARNALELSRGADIILDGLDNFESRYLLNDLAVKRGLPYIYGGAVATTGLSMAILPHGRHRQRSGADRDDRQPAVPWTDAQATPCLRCVFPEAPPPGTSPTCDTAGVLGGVVQAVAAHQATQAIKLLSGNLDAVDRRLLSIDVWSNMFSAFDVSGARSQRCPCCGLGRFEFLDGAAGSATTTLCGRNAVQVSPPPSAGGRDLRLDLAALANRLRAHGSFACTPYLLRGVFGREAPREGQTIELTVFPDGRAIIKGTAEPDEARAIYARFVGH
jgi:adenylyltransferase/sulfurtransferase